MGEQPRQMKRRGFLGASGLALASGALFPDVAAAKWDAHQFTAIERRNAAVVQDFLAGWEAADAVKQSGLCHETVIARPTAHNQKAVALSGRAALHDFAARVFTGGTTVKFKVLDTAAKGPIVVNNRIDRLIRAAGSTDVYYVGVFLVVDGRIAEWSDYEVAPSTPVKPGQRL